VIIDNNKYSITYPGRVVEYFPATQTATILICAETVYNDSGSLYATTKRLPLEGVPVHTSGGGGWHQTFPIAAGDTCVIHFSQVGYDHWLYQDKDTAGKLANLPKPWLARQFNEDDGLAIVGTNTLPRAIQDYNATDAEFRNANRDQRISLKADGNIHIKTGSTTINVAPSGAITVTATQVDVVTPLTTMSGDVTIAGNLDITGTTTSGGLITGSGGLVISGGTGASVTGDLETTGEVTAQGVELSTHTHNENNNTGGPTDAPN